MKFKNVYRNALDLLTRIFSFVRRTTSGVAIIYYLKICQNWPRKSNYRINIDRICFFRLRDFLFFELALRWPQFLFNHIQIHVSNIGIKHQGGVGNCTWSWSDNINVCRNALYLLSTNPVLCECVYVCDEPLPIEPSFCFVLSFPQKWLKYKTIIAMKKCSTSWPRLWLCYFTCVRHFSGSNRDFVFLLKTGHNRKKVLLSGLCWQSIIFSLLRLFILVDFFVNIHTRHYMTIVSVCLIPYCHFYFYTHY